MTKGASYRTFDNNLALKVASQGPKIASKGGYLPSIQAAGNAAAVKLANVKCGAGLAHIVSAPLLPFPASLINSLVG